ncbi:hypothetical protein B0H34DRAFT_706048 [Crassisporium funariophilum]|nr:hypothetical protein B0H34DRAFT_706048 [Crassisporium funariophilum]
MADAQAGRATIICGNNGCQRTSLDAKLLACGGCKTRSYCGRACQKADWQRHKPLCAASPTAPSVQSIHDRLIVAWDRKHMNHVLGYVAGSIYNAFLSERGSNIPADVWASFSSCYTVEITLQKVKTERKVPREKRVRFAEANFIKAEDALPPERLVRFQQGINSQPYTITTIYRLWEGSAPLAMVTISHAFKLDTLFVGGVVPPTSSIYRGFLEAVAE